MKKAFTLLEMMIAISILSIMMLFLYQSNAALQFSNKTYKKEAKEIITINKIREVIYLDFLLSISTVSFHHEKHKADTIFMQTTHSLHRRINPYVTYLVQENKLYRVESLKKVTKLPLPRDEEYSIDFITKIKGLDLYKAKKTKQFLIVLILDTKQQIMMKLSSLN